jgi:folate-dependent phosphoribosylglycinamide formyltransferase PurN
LKDSQKRIEFEEELFGEVNKLSPDLIVLAGWMLILGDNFIVKTSRSRIPIINLHPALLTRGNEKTVNTSKGEIRVIRGANAIHEAYEEGLEVSGVTIHKVVSGPFDTGPIILQQEVYRVEGETVEEWEKRIHQVEYCLLPAAINKVIFAMKLGYDINDNYSDW